MSMKPILIVKAGTTFPGTANLYGDFEDWTLARMGVPTDQAIVAEVFNGGSLPEDDAFSGVVVTGSHSMVTSRESWSERVAARIPGWVERNVPFLGICYGHQLLAHAMGGQVGFHPGGPEIGTVSVFVNSEGKHDLLFGNLPDEFAAHVTHFQTALKPPPGACVLACNAFEPVHAFRLGDCAWGVQFHPEFNADIMQAYLDEQASALQSLGRDVARLRESIAETPEANGLLRIFADSIRERAKASA